MVDNPFLRQYVLQHFLNTFDDGDLKKYVVRQFLSGDLWEHATIFDVPGKKVLELTSAYSLACREFETTDLKVSFAPKGQEP